MLSKRKQKKLESIRRRIALLTAKIEHAEAERASLQCEAVRLTQFIECNDPAAVECVRELTRRGAKHAAVYTDGALRVSKSYCPMSPERWQWVVCVSRNNKPVKEDEARAVACRFVLDLAIDEVQFGRNLTSVWFHSM